MHSKAQKIKSLFEAEGISISEWATARGYNVRTVYAVIRGELKCRRGISHSIAVDLGIKPPAKEPRFGLSVR